jgi:hypothetical protein
MSGARGALRNAAFELGRRRPIAVFTGEPKGSWAHVYYVSFHDPINSTRPTEGFYPVFLLSVDQKICWVSVLLAAGSVGITARGGWSNERGRRLRTRADFLSSELQLRNGWRRGPIELGAKLTWLHEERGKLHGAGRAYECGSIISKCFDPGDPPVNLEAWLNEAFSYFDEIFEREALYLATSLPREEVPSRVDQAAAAITGRLAEERFLSWVIENHPEWGTPRDMTDRVGLGFDFEFHESGIRVEVKGSRGKLEDIRLTEREWEVAQSIGKDYVLCLVTSLDSPSGYDVAILADPFSLLKEAVLLQTRLQITYTVSRLELVKALAGSR